MVFDLERTSLKDRKRVIVVDKGTISVPEDWDSRNAKHILIPVLRAPAIKPSGLPPVFVLNGGPGDSNLHPSLVPEYLLKDHDIVLVGYRGADGATKFLFPRVKKAVLGFRFNKPDQSFSRIKAAFLEECSRLRDRGFDPGCYSIDMVVEDLNFVREALGYDRVLVSSGSYGTRLALLWSSRYPATIHRVLQCAVNPPGRFVWEPAMIDIQWAKIESLRKNDADNLSQVPDLLMLIQRVRSTLPKRWGLVKLDPIKIESLSFMMMFDIAAVGSVVEAYVKASRADFSGLAALSEMHDVLNSMVPIRWGDFFLKGLADHDSARDYRRDMVSNCGGFSSYSSYVYFGWLDAETKTELGLKAPRSIPATCPVETLLVSGSIDFSTPVEFSVNEMLPRLTRGHQIVISEAGHMNLWHFGNPIFQKITRDFFDSGVIGEESYDYRPLLFSRTINLPLIGQAIQFTKWLLIAVAVGLVTLGVWYISGKNA